jgi:hypothetical protein
MDKKNPKDPLTTLNAKYPVPAVGKQPDGMNDDDWKKVKAERSAARRNALQSREQERQTVQFREQLKKYENHEQSIHAFATNTLFKPFEDKKIQEWLGSICINSHRWSFGVHSIRKDCESH